MSLKIDPRTIIFDHLETLRSRDTGRTSVVDIAVFYFLPAIAAPLPLLLGDTSVQEFCTAIIEAFAVLTALLLNLQALIITRVPSQNKRSSEDEVSATLAASRSAMRHQLLLEISMNISYAILAAIIVIVIFVVAFILKYSWIQVVGFYVVVHFVLTALMILKRFHILIKSDVEDAG